MKKFLKKEFLVPLIAALILVAYFVFTREVSPTGLFIISLGYGVAAGIVASKWKDSKE